MGDEIPIRYRARRLGSNLGRDRSVPRLTVQKKAERNSKK